MLFFRHGGPGGGTSPRDRTFFDPKVYRIVLMDQRGAGKSLPVAELRVCPFFTYLCPTYKTKGLDYFRFVS